MFVLSQAPNGAISSSSILSLPSNSTKNPTLSSKSKRFPSTNPTKPLRHHLAFATADRNNPNPSSSTIRPLSTEKDGIAFVGDDGVPLEGVIQFDKPDDTASKLLSWAQVGILAGGDVLGLLIFSAIGRFSHGFPVLDFETFRTADPFIAGWFLSAYFVGGYGDDAKGLSGTNPAVLAALKSWVIGIPLGIIIRSVTSGHIPATAFMLVTMGSTGVLMTGWRALACNILPRKQNKSDVYKRGSPFELFELLTSLVRRW